MVTGAGGRTGGLIVKKLLEDKERIQSVKGTVRSKKAPLPKQLADAGLTEADVIEFDLAAAAEAANSSIKANTAAADLVEALPDADVLVIVTSAVPQIKYSSLIGVIAGRLVGRKSMPGFTWKQNQLPEKVSGLRSAVCAIKGVGVQVHSRCAWCHTKHTCAPTPCNKQNKRRRRRAQAEVPAACSTAGMLRH